MEKWICLCVRMRKRRRKRKRGARLDVVGRNGTEEVYYASGRDIARIYANVRDRGAVRKVYSREREGREWLCAVEGLVLGWG